MVLGFSPHSTRSSVPSGTSGEMVASDRARFSFELAQPTDVLLQFEAAAIPEQQVLESNCRLTEAETMARVPSQDAIGERIWLRAEGLFEVDYSARVEVGRILPDLKRVSGAGDGGPKALHVVSDHGVPQGLELAHDAELLLRQHAREHDGLEAGGALAHDGDGELGAGGRQDAAVVGVGAQPVRRVKKSPQPIAAKRRLHAKVRQRVQQIREAFVARLAGRQGQPQRLADTGKQRGAAMPLSREYPCAGGQGRVCSARTKGGDVQ
mgnify:CR=1 FL=1